jgi:hypothetical protein
MLLKWLLCGMGGSKCLTHFYLGRTHDVVMHNALIIHCIEVSSDRTGTLSIICCPRRGMVQLHILRDMESEVIIAFVAMCIHGSGVESIMWMWIIWTCAW